MPVKFTAKVLLVGLLLSSSTVVRVGNSADQKTAGWEPNSIRVASALSRNHALTVTSSQRVAGDIFRQHSARKSVTHGGVARRESALPVNPVSRLMVATERSPSYLSFRLSRPGGRAPPASV